MKGALKMANIREIVEKSYKKKGRDSNRLAIGSTVKVNTRIVEGGKERIQTFEGILIAKKGVNLDSMITVRKISAGGIGVERTFPMHSPMIESITVVKQGDSSKAKLYHLRDAFGRKAKKEAKKFASESLSSDSVDMNKEAAEIEAEKAKSKEERKAEHAAQKAADKKGGKKKP
jgi:large subunit ribosomal protein L19